MVRVKICGITRSEDAVLALQCGAWALGFIFYPPSPRFIAPEAVGRLLDELAEQGLKAAKAVGVFVNSAEADIRAAVLKSGVDTVQLHGDETPALLAELQDLSVIKAFRFSSAGQLADLAAYEAHASAFLFDAAVPGSYGGTGQRSDWDLLAQVKSSKPLIVSGGLHPKNVKAAVARLQPYALDLSSGVEAAPGIKDPQKIKQLFQELGGAHAVDS